MSVVRGAEAPTFSVPGFEFTGQTAPSRGATELSTWRVKALPGAVSAPHYLDHEEVFLVINGSVVFIVAGEPVEVNAGDAFSLPPQTTLQLSNPNTEAAEVVCCLSKDGRATLADGTEVGTPPWAR